MILRKFVCLIKTKIVSLSTVHELTILSDYCPVHFVFVLVWRGFMLVAELLQEAAGLLSVRRAATPVRLYHFLTRCFKFSHFVHYNLPLPALYAAKPLITPTTNTKKSITKSRNCTRISNFLKFLKDIYIYIYIYLYM